MTTAAAHVTAPPYLIGALRSRLVAKLTGLTKRQLGYWHRTGLIEAQVDPGARGYPRLYSWADYLRLREAAKLAADGVPTTTIRKAVEYLESRVPDWYLLPLQIEGAHVIARLEAKGVEIVPELGGQIPLFRMLEEIHDEGPLGELRQFNDAVEMDPRVHAGSPIVAQTRIETSNIGGLCNLGYKADDIADVYKLPRELVRRAIEFEKLVA